MRHGGSLLIPEDVCWELLRDSSMGRVTLSAPDLPGILPVRYYTDGDEIVLCLGDHEVPHDVVRGDCIAFAVDEMDSASRAGWSVQVRGTVVSPGALVVPVECGVAQSGQLVRIHPESVVGYHIELCPFFSAFEDLVTRLEESDDVTSSDCDWVGSFDPLDSAGLLDVGLDGVGVPHVSTDVLVVDFQDALRETTADVLRQDGSSVLEAESAEEAVEILARRDVRLMLLEPDLPLGSAVDLVDQLDEITQVVIFSSSPVSPEDRARLDGKVVCYVEKPVAPDELIALVQGLLGRSDAA